MDVVIDLLGRAVLAGKRDVAVAVSKIGVVHIRTVGKTAIVTFVPEAASRTSLAGAFYKIADFSPERTIVVAGIGNSAFWICPGHTCRAENDRRVGLDEDEFNARHCRRCGRALPLEPVRGAAIRR